MLWGEELMQIPANHPCARSKSCGTSDCLIQGSSLLQTFTRYARISIYPHVHAETQMHASIHPTTHTETRYFHVDITYNVCVLLYIYIYRTVCIYVIIRHQGQHRQNHQQIDKSLNLKLIIRSTKQSTEDDTTI